MITTEDILKELRAGADLDAIGDEIATKLNEAKARYEYEQKELERIQKEKEDTKFKMIGDMVESVVLCLGQYYPNLCNEVFPKDEVDIDVVAQNVMAMLDLGEELYGNPELRNTILALGKDNPWASFVQKEEKKGRTQPSTSANNSFMNILNSFLDE